jgi:signal transduction histidine kinase
MDLCTTSTDPAVHGDLRIVERLVRTVGSSLDVADVARRSLEILADEFGTDTAEFLLLDEVEQHLELVDAIPSSSAPHRERWLLPPRLNAILLSSPTVARIEADDLPEPLRSDGPRTAFRLTDGEATVGLLLLPARGPMIDDGPRSDVLVRTVGGLIGSWVGRSLVHASLIGVTDRLDSARRFQQHVLDHVSHEFNTPLMIMRSSAEFADTDDGTERSAFLDMHEQALERLERLVQGVLEVASHDAESHVHDVDGVELRSLVLDPLFEVAAWRRERLRYDVELPEGRRYRLDLEGLGLTLEHLLRNAWSFAVESGGSASMFVRVVRAERISSLSECFEASMQELRAEGDDRPARGADVDGDHLLVEVADTGIGIPGDEQELVFEPFTQAHNSPLRGVSGAGMGLPTCRKRVRSMGGRIDLASEVGRGSLLRVVVPIT